VLGRWKKFAARMDSGQSRANDWVLRRAGVLAEDDHLSEARLGRILSITVDGADLPSLSTAKTEKLAAGVSVGPRTYCGYSATKLFLFDRVGVFAPPLWQVEEVSRTDLLLDFRCLMARSGATRPQVLRVTWQIQDNEIDIAGFTERLRTTWQSSQPR
jgi:hypothetical protein